MNKRFFLRFLTGGPMGNRTPTSSMPWMRNSHFTIGPKIFFKLIFQIFLLIIAKNTN